MANFKDPTTNSDDRSNRYWGLLYELSFIGIFHGKDEGTGNIHARNGEWGDAGNSSRGARHVTTARENELVDEPLNIDVRCVKIHRSM